MESVAVLGLGAMGSRMAANLVKAGYAVAVWNRSPDKAAPLGTAGARVAATPREAAEGAGAVISVLRDDEAARTTWLDPGTGALAGLAEGALAIESSTVTPGWIDELGSACAARGVALLDAPVAGSRPQAEAGQLNFLVGGEAAALERATPLLRTMGKAIHHAGRLGSGATLKLAVNGLLGLQVAAAGELFALLSRCGLEEARSVEILGELSIASPALKVALQQMRDRSFQPLFPAEMMAKDLGYLRRLADARGSEIPLGDATRAVFERAVEAGYGEEQMSGLLRLYL